MKASVFFIVAALFTAITTNAKTLVVMAALQTTCILSSAICARRLMLM